MLVISGSRSPVEGAAVVRVDREPTRPGWTWVRLVGFPEDVATFEVAEEVLAVR